MIRNRPPRYLLIGIGVSLAAALTRLLVAQFVPGDLFVPVHTTREVAGPAETLYVKGIAWGMTVRRIELSNPRMMELYDRMDSLGLELAR